MVNSLRSLLILIFFSNSASAQTSSETILAKCQQIKRVITDNPKTSLVAAGLVGIAGGSFLTYKALQPNIAPLTEMAETFSQAGFEMAFAQWKGIGFLMLYGFDDDNASAILKAAQSGNADDFTKVVSEFFNFKNQIARFGEGPTNLTSEILKKMDENLPDVINEMRTKIRALGTPKDLGELRVFRGKIWGLFQEYFDGIAYELVQKPEFKGALHGGLVQQLVGKRLPQFFRILNSGQAVTGALPAGEIETLSKLGVKPATLDRLRNISSSAGSSFKAWVKWLAAGMKNLKELNFRALLTREGLRSMGRGLFRSFFSASAVLATLPTNISNDANSNASEEGRFNARLARVLDGAPCETLTTNLEQIEDTGIKIGVTSLADKAAIYMTDYANVLSEQASHATSGKTKTQR